MKISMAQINLIVGDFTGNYKKIENAFKEAQNEQADLIVFPEMAICSYYPEDLLLREDFIIQHDATLKKVIKLNKNCQLDILIGGVFNEAGNFFNAAFLISQGEVKKIFTKKHLPNLSIFNESRYFEKGFEDGLVNINGHLVNVAICRDIWEDLGEIISKKAEFTVVLNASPFEKNKFQARLQICQEIARNFNQKIFYVNLVGGQDEVIYDGGSFGLNENGDFLNSPKFFVESLEYIDLKDKQIIECPEIDENRQIYEAIMLGLKDYMSKNGFESVILGLSGGIDSALTTAIAIDVLGKENVHVVALPTRFTSKQSFEDASMCQKLMDINRIDEIKIEQIFEQTLETLKPFFIGKEQDVTEENLQSRIRGMVLMALSNKFGHMLLTTSNKSELATGYGTLYGDMCGSYNLLKDLYKTEVYELAKWRNANFPNGAKGNLWKIIPENILTKEPTAELAENQKDSDSLPKYEILDLILFELIENEQNTKDISKNHNISLEIVESVAALLKNSEFKRRQAAPGVRLTVKSFGRDRLYPMTNKFKF